MPDMQEKIEETEVVDRGDTQVVREKTSTSSTAETRLTLTNGIYLLLGVIDAFLIFRFFLKLLGANPASGFVNFVYDVSGFLVAPFTAIFNSATTQGDVTKGVFDPAILVAMLVYSVVAWGVVKLVHIDTHTTE
jgi:hypothetical protein